MSDAILFRTRPVDGIWYSLSPALIPPDETGDWLDLHRHQEESVIVMARFKGVAAAVSWIWRTHDVDPGLWYRPDEETEVPAPR
jgi:hypothetical protein